MKGKSEMLYAGGCLCGKVRYRAEATPINERVCHCRLCQKAVGAAFNARLLFAGNDVSIEGSMRWAHSSPDLQRGFCLECGTTVFTRRLSNGVVGVGSGTLDEPSLFRPQMHIFASMKQPWIVLDDGLPQYEEWPPA
ncbi:MAG: GFA family protein [Rhizobiaceae bacterium]